jgi:hypothetical protein
MHYASVVGAKERQMISTKNWRGKLGDRRVAGKTPETPAKLAENALIQAAG